MRAPTAGNMMLYSIIEIEDQAIRNELAHLNLITCTGSWDSAAGTHSKRLVVFADATLPYSEEGSASD
jgi:hypothetical protein